MKTLINFIALSSSFLSLVSCASNDVPALGAGEHAIRGKVVNASVNTVDIMTPQGKCYQFSTASARKNLKNGLEVDNRVVITYKGEIKGIDTQGAKVTSISDYNIW